MMKSPLQEKSYDFALSIIQLTKDLQKTQKEYVMSRQLLRSGTSIGALIREAKYGRSIVDFSNKLTIALKEANETDYWLCLLKDSQFMEEETFVKLHALCNELIAMLVSSVKTSRT